MKSLLEYLNHSSKKSINYINIYINKDNNVCVEYDGHRFAIARGTNDRASYNKAVSFTGGSVGRQYNWALSSVDELKVIYDNLNEINIALEKVGGEEFYSDGYYWCYKLDNTSMKLYRFSFATGKSEYWSLKDQNFKVKYVDRDI